MVMKLKKLKTYLTIICLTLSSVMISAKNFVLVIDPGHGGKDVGAIGDFAKEKDINLGVALKFGELVKKNYSNVKVVYTRDDDTFISLQERADIANKAKGDLFVSIHTNSVDMKSPSRYTVAGSETYTLGLHRSKENLAVAMRENSVIELEDDYSANYQGFDPNSQESYIIFELNQSKHLEQSVNFASLVQSEFKKSGQVDKGVRQAGFWVLAKTSMPAVLVELDFICNPKQETVLASESGQKKLAESIFTAFSKYKEQSDYYKENKTEANVKTEKSKKKETKQEVKSSNSSVDKSSSTSSKNKTEYRIQFLSSAKQLSKSDSAFLGLDDIDYYKEGKWYKYTAFPTNDKNKAEKSLEKVRKTYKDAFIVEFENNKRIK